MARQPRLEYAGAIHHVMSRGNDGIPIFRDDEDRALFLELLAEEVVRARWILRDYSLLGNHFHLKIETPECTLSVGMHRLLSRYAQRFNRRHRRRGHLFQERFKNLLVENESYGLELSRYIALNAVRAGLATRPEEWQWCSYAALAGFVPRPSWLAEDLRGLGPDRITRQKEYRAFVLAGINATDDLLDRTISGMYLGTPAWIDKIQALLDESERSEEHTREQVHPGRPDLRDVLEVVAATFDTTIESIQTTRGTLERKVVAYLAFEEGLVTLRSIAEQLRLRSRSAVSNLVSRCRREIVTDPEVRSLAEACRQRMRRRPPPFSFPPQVPPLTARGYHRAGPRSGRNQQGR